MTLTTATRPRSSTTAAFTTPTTATSATRPPRAPRRSTTAPGTATGGQVVWTRLTSDTVKGTAATGQAFVLVHRRRGQTLPSDETGAVLDNRRVQRPGWYLLGQTTGPAQWMAVDAARACSRTEVVHILGWAPTGQYTTAGDRLHQLSGAHHTLRSLIDEHLGGAR